MLRNNSLLINTIIPELMTISIIILQMKWGGVGEDKHFMCQCLHDVNVNHHISTVTRTLENEQSVSHAVTLHNLYRIYKLLYA